MGQSMKVHFIHSKNTENSGDLVCGYYRFFLEKFKKYTILIHDIAQIDFSLIKSDDIVIIGGGGLLNCADLWNYNINRVAKICKNVVVFAAGFNCHFASKVDIPIKLRQCALVGIRDYEHPSGFEYIPCASCLSAEFDRVFPIKRKFGAVQHYLFGFKHALDIDFIYNNESFSKIIEFIGSSEVIVTNTYHAAYWATLLGKKVIMESAFSEKFKYLKYPPVNFSGNLEQDAAVAKIYPGVLEESRALVEDFGDRIGLLCHDEKSQNLKRFIVKLACLIIPKKSWRKRLRFRFSSVKQAPRGNLKN